MGSKGTNTKSFALWDELAHLRVTPEAGAVSIYKRNQHDSVSLVGRPYQIHIPVPETKGGIRKSLRTPECTNAISKAEEMVVDVKV